MTTKPRAPIDILLGNPMPGTDAELLDRHFRVHRGRPEEFDESVRTSIRGYVAKGSVGLSTAQMALLPRLEIIHALGAGSENIDSTEARQRGIVLSDGIGVNAGTVADHAMALVLALLRDLPAGDKACREGRWQSGPSPLAARGRRMGLLGFGAIGQAIAARASAFGMTIGYHARTCRTELPQAYEATPLELARRSDILVAALPETPETRGIVSKEVLAALGHDAILINVGRGSAVAMNALIKVLSTGAIRGAGLDVFEHEPRIAEALLRLDNVILSPHIAGRAPDTHDALAHHALERLLAHFIAP